jgi:tetratricopeptide (TPR) repeat protein
VAHQALGEWEDALPLAEERVKLARSIGDPLELAKALSQVSSPYQALGDLDRARTVGIEALDIARHQPEREVLVPALQNLAVTEQLREDYAAADALLTEAIELNRELNAHGGLAHALQNLGQIRVCEGLYESADACFREALPILLGSDRMVFATALMGISHLAWHQGDEIRAARLLARAEALHKEIAYVPLPAYHAMYQQSTSDLRQSRTRPEIEAAWQQGAAMSLEDALAEALRTERTG